MLSKYAVAWLVLLSGGVFGLFLAGHRIPHRQAPRRTWQAPYAIAAQGPFVGGPRRRSAIVLPFCTMAAGRNWTGVAVRPRSRSRPQPFWTLRSTKRLSLFLGALLD